MTDPTTPDMEAITIETYRDGVLIGTRTVFAPKPPPSTEELQRRIAELEARLREAEADNEPEPGANEEVP